jgi:7-cyano-7-deazaguanine synthase in queuosine biosynthesis
MSIKNAIDPSQTPHKSNVVLLGGGADSMTLCLDLISKKIPFSVMHVDYEQLALKYERQAIYNFCIDYKIVYINEYCEEIHNTNPEPSKLFNGPMYSNPYLLGRNYYLVGKALQLFDNVWLGLSEGQIFDCTQEFVDSYNQLLKHAFDGKRKIYAPYVNYSKTDVVKLGYELIGDKYFDYVATCWTPIYNDFTGIWSSCGKCHHCKHLVDIKKEIGVA